MAASARSAGGRREATEARRARRATVTDADEVMEAAAAFLSVRPRSVAETRRRLHHLGYPHELVAEVVRRLIDVGYLDDAAFARWWIESRDRARPRGALALRRELLLKGVPRDVVDEILADRSAGFVDGGVAAGAQGAAATRGEAADADTDAARRLLARRQAALLREPDPRRRRQRAYALLARHGFTPDVCRAVAATIGDASAEPSDEDVELSGAPV